MRVEMELAGVRFALDPAAVSAIRYRVQYGESAVHALSSCATPREAEGRLLRVSWMMIPPADRPELPDFAKLARRDGGFFRKALAAREALLAVDPLAPRREGGDGAPFDEYDILALMSAAGVDMRLIYELPIMHIVSVVGRYFDMKDTERKVYRPMPQEDRALLYPRRRKGEAHGGQDSHGGI